MNKKWLGAGLIFLLLLVGGFTWQATRPAKQVYKQERIPTFFFHGFGSSYRAEEHMVGAARDAGVTRTVVRANVDKQGQVSLIGDLKDTDTNPIIEVNYEDNRQTDYNKHGVYAQAVVAKVREVYPFDQMNFVAHSAGNWSILYYMIQTAQDSKRPQLVKQVNIAGHFAGLEFDGIADAARLPEGLTLAADGTPSAMNENYRYLSQTREVYPAGQVDVLNIIGNIGGDTDGSVANVSSLSLKYLMEPKAKSYREEWINGPGGQHSKLHENKEVDQILIDFLWQKAQ